MTLATLKPVIDGKYSCFDKNIIVSICNWYGVDCSAYFLDFFLIKYTSCDEYPLFDNKYIYFGSDYKYELLQRYSGLKRKRYVINDENRFMLVDEIIQNLNNDKPVGILMDSFFCHWNRYYHTLHREHAILLVGYDARCNEFVCLDGYITEQKQYISAEIVFLHYYRIYIFDKVDVHKKLCCTDFREIMKKSFTNVQGYSMLQGLYNMKNDIMNAIESIKNYNILYLDKAFFLLRLKQVSWSRFNMAQIVHSRFKLNNHLRHKMSEMLFQESDLWNNLNIGLVKACYTNIRQDYFQKIAIIMDRIIELNQNELKCLQ